MTDILEIARQLGEAGWKLVPMEPTEEMLNQRLCRGPSKAIYRDMLAAAPEPSAAARAVLKRVGSGVTECHGITEYWLKNYVHKSMCSICGNRGVFDTRGVKTAAGLECGKVNFCICPNGQKMRELGRETPSPPPASVAGDRGAVTDAEFSVALEAFRERSDQGCMTASSLHAALEAFLAHRQGAETLAELIEIGKQAARDYAKKHSWTGKQVTEGDAEAHAETAIRAAHAHMQGASLGYVVRWEAYLDYGPTAQAAFISQNRVGRIHAIQEGRCWVWVFIINGRSEQAGTAETEALAKSALLAAIHEYMRGFGLVPLPAEGTFREGIEAAANICERAATQCENYAASGEGPLLKSHIKWAEAHRADARAIRAIKQDGEA